MRRPRFLLVVITSLAVLSGCDSTGPDIDNVGAINVDAQQNRTRLEIGDSVQLSASVLNTTGATMSNVQVQWHSSETTVANVSPGGLVTAVGTGQAVITAQVGTVTGTIDITVATPACTSARTAGTIAVGQTRASTLRNSGCIMPHGAIAEGWRISTTEPVNLRFTLSSSEFDPLVLVTDMHLNYREWAEGTGDDAVLVVSLPAGEFIIWATMFEGTQAGAYQLQVEQGPPLCTTAGAARTIAMGRTVAGTLTGSSCILPHHAPGEGWRFSTDSTVTVRAVLGSSDFDALVVVTDMALEPLAFAERSDSAADAVLFATLPAGDYVIWATTFEPTATGAYQLAVQQVETASCTAAGGSITVGQTVTGRLEHTDCVMPFIGRTDLWQFVADATTPVRIDLASTDFDTYLYVSDAAGNILHQDDDGGGSFNSRLTVTLAPGTYLFWASSFNPNAVGAYQLSVTSASAATADGAPVGTGSKAFGGQPARLSWDSMARMAERLRTYRK